MMLPLGIWLCEMKGISFRRGFFCDDETIRFPYKDSTVPGYALIVISVSCPVVLVSSGDRLTLVARQGRVRDGL